MGASRLSGDTADPMHGIDVLARYGGGTDGGADPVVGATKYAALDSVAGAASHLRCAIAADPATLLAEGARLRTEGSVEVLEFAPYQTTADVALSLSFSLRGVLGDLAVSSGASRSCAAVGI